MLWISTTRPSGKEKSFSPGTDMRSSARLSQNRYPCILVHLRVSLKSVPSWAEVVAAMTKWSSESDSTTITPLTGMTHHGNQIRQRFTFRLANCDGVVRVEKSRNVEVERLEDHETIPI